MSLIIGAMRDRLILVRGCSSGTDRLPIKSFNRGLAPLKLDVASGVPDIPGGLSRVSRYPLIRLVCSYARGL